MYFTYFSCAHCLFCFQQVFVHMDNFPLNLLFSRLNSARSLSLSSYGRSATLCGTCHPTSFPFQVPSLLSAPALGALFLLVDPAPLDFCPTISSLSPCFLSIAAFQLLFNLHSAELNFCLCCLTQNFCQGFFSHFPGSALFPFFPLPSCDARKLPDYEEHRDPHWCPTLFCCLGGNYF